jgi:hypothetical protein
MIKIHLTGPSVRNDGSYVDAGADIEVGEAADQIHPMRAAELVVQSRAIDPDAPVAVVEPEGDGTSGETTGTKRSK